MLLAWQLAGKQKFSNILFSIFDNKFIIQLTFTMLCTDNYNICLIITNNYHYHSLQWLKSCCPICQIEQKHTFWFTRKLILEWSEKLFLNGVCPHMHAYKNSAFYHFWIVSKVVR